MNEQIRQLKEQASSYASKKSNEAEEWQRIYENKFAELIIRECATIAHKWQDEYDVEELGYLYVDDCIKKHFGVEE